MVNSDGYKLFVNQVELVSQTNPGLTSFVKEGIPGLKGEINLVDDGSGSIDTYSVEILATSNFPNSFPVVFEVGNKIPINYDWHVYETDGHCCIKTTPEEMLACKKGITLSGFIEEEVKPYFFNQTFRRLNGYFYQERSHGLKGWIEFFKETFNTTDMDLIKEGLKFISKKEKPDRVSLCFCGSGKKYRKCHRDTYDKLSTLSTTDFEFIFEVLGID